jgi:hypothetical protein
MPSSTDRPRFNLVKARSKVIKQLSRFSDSYIFEVLDVEPTLEKGRLKYNGKLANNYAKSIINNMNESEIRYLASQLGVNIG